MKNELEERLKLTTKFTKCFIISLQTLQNLLGEYKQTNRDYKSIRLASINLTNKSTEVKCY